MKSGRVFSHVVQATRAGEYTLSGDQLIVECPVCQKKGHLYVFVPKGLFHCFKCDFSGTLRSQILASPAKWRPVVSLRTTPSDRREGASRATEGGGGYVGGDRPAANSSGLVCLQDEPTSPLMEMNMRKVYAYCYERGMTDKQIEDYRVSVIEGEGRVYFPYWSQAGTTTYWMGRAVSDDVEPKTIEPPDVDKPLFGRHVHKLGQTVVLVEGVFDHFSTPYSYALMGSTIAPGQTMQLRGEGVLRVFVLLDADARQQQSVRVAEKLLRAGLKPFPVLLQNTKKDPADLGFKVMRDLVDRLRETPMRQKPRILRLFVPSVGSTKQRHGHGSRSD